MEHPKGWSDRGTPPQDELGPVRWYLRDAYADRAPSEQVWPRILAQVRSERARNGAKQDVSFRGAIRVMRTAAVGVFLLAVAVQLLRPALPERAVAHTRGAGRPVPASAFPRDALSGYVLVQEARAENLRRARSIPEL